MTDTDTEGYAFRFFLFALAVFLMMQTLAIITGGAASQEVHEVFSAPEIYAQNLINGGGNLRIMLFLDLFFIIGYGGALTLTAYANRAGHLMMGWVAGLGFGLVMVLDLGENLLMLQLLQLAEFGETPSLGQITWQLGISGAKWLWTSIAVVALTFTLPQNTGLERLLVWSARIALPVGTGLFVTGAVNMQLLGGLLVLVGMVGGFILLALTIWQRRA